MEKLNITKGTWELRKSISPASENFKIISKNNIGQEIKILAETFIHSRAGMGNISKEEMASNANLIAEAGNVANECGLTPRELLKQRDELIKEAKHFCEHLERHGKANGNSFYFTFKELIKATNQ